MPLDVPLSDPKEDPERRQGIIRNSQEKIVVETEIQFLHRLINEQATRIHALAVRVTALEGIRCDDIVHTAIKKR